MANTNLTKHEHRKLNHAHSLFTKVFRQVAEESTYSFAELSRKAGIARWRIDNFLYKGLVPTEVEMGRLRRELGDGPALKIQRAKERVVAPRLVKECAALRGRLEEVIGRLKELEGEKGS